MKLIVGVLVACVVLIVGLKFLVSQEELPVDNNGVEKGENALISSNGIHWHPTLKIFIRGEEVPIPANIGLIGGHNPMHTHDPDGIIHLEYSGIVRENDIRLGKFFELWGKTFNESQIFENVNSDTERVYMYVNGEENIEYGNYLLQHEDVVEIRFEEKGDSDAEKEPDKEDGSEETAE